MCAGGAWVPLPSSPRLIVEHSRQHDDYGNEDAGKEKGQGANDGSARALKLLAKQQRKLIEFKVLWRISAHDSEYFFPLYKLKAVASGYVPG